MADIKNHRNLALLAAALLAALLLASCSEEPTQENSLPSALPLTGLVVRDTTIGSTGSTVYKQYVPMNGLLDLLGNAGNRTASMAIGFYPSSFPVRDTIAVYSAKLRLHSAYFAGDTLGTFGFTVYRIMRGWTENTVQWDTLQLGFYEASVERGSYTGFGGRDTQTVIVNLDTAMVREWFRTNSATQTTKFGVVLVPTQNCAMVRGFHSFSSDSTSLVPSLEVIAGNVAGTSRDTAVYSSGMDTFVGNADNLNTDPSLLYLQAGVVYRSSLKFDVSSIPRGAIINTAELVLFRNDQASRLNRFSVDTTIMAHVRLGYDSTFESGGILAHRLAGIKPGITIDIRHAVQSWIRGTNYGIILRVGSSAEYSSFDQFAFYNQSAADPTVRPRLKVIYSVVKP